MSVDRADSVSEDPDVPFDYEDEDEIMAELRQVRRDIMAEFNNDLGAYVAYLQSSQFRAFISGFREARFRGLTSNSSMKPMPPEPQHEPALDGKTRSPLDELQV